jgi:hypothetical protein
MRWPCVSRRAYDLLERLLASQIRRAEQAEARVDQLTRDLVTMTREGYQPAPVMTPDLPPADTLPLAVADALDGLGLAPADHAREAARLHALMDEGMDPTEAIRRLYEG